MNERPLVLVVDDEPGILRLVEIELQTEGFEVLSARSAEDALKLLQDNHPDIVVADIMMPGATGLELMRQVRSSISVPFILLTARGRDEDKVQGLELGADDYVAKPFNPSELSARVRAVLRRGSRPETDNAIEIDDLRIDLDMRLVSRNGSIVSLTGTEWRLLEQLATNPGRVMLSRDLLSRVWSDQLRDDLQYLRGWISSLRKKLEPDPQNPTVIKTYPGVGYVLNVSSAGSLADEAVEAVEPTA